MTRLHELLPMALLASSLIHPAMAQDTSGQPSAMAPPAYGPGMMGDMTPEQREQHWEQMRQQGYNPGMGRGYGPGMISDMPPMPGPDPAASQ